MPGKYTGKMLDRHPYSGTGSPSGGERVYLNLNGDHTCSFESSSLILYGKWRLSHDTLTCFYSKQKYHKRAMKRPISGSVNFDTQFIVDSENCLYPIAGKVTFCKLKK